MEFIRSWKFTAIIVAIIAVLAIAGVIYGVTTHVEAGFDEEWPEWSGMPLVVCPRSYVDEPTQTTAAQNAVDHAVEVTERRLGFHAFNVQYVLPDTSCDIVITVGAPTERGDLDPGGDADIVDGRCVVRTANTGTTELLDLTIQHELGHCLGLAHDDYQGSIMVGGEGRALRHTPDGQFPPRITDWDVDLLRRRYDR